MHHNKSTCMKMMRFLNNVTLVVTAKILIIMQKLTTFTWTLTDKQYNMIKQCTENQNAVLNIYILSLSNLLFIQQSLPMK